MTGACLANGRLVSSGPNTRVLLHCEEIEGTGDEQLLVEARPRVEHLNRQATNSRVERRSRTKNIPDPMSMTSLGSVIGRD